MCAGSTSCSQHWSSGGRNGVGQCSVSMDDFPEFMKRAVNRIAKSNQATPGVEGYVFDGADGSQMAFWTCGETAVSAAHSHEYDEYMMVVQGQYTLIIDGSRIPLTAGEEYFIPRGVLHSGEVLAGTRTIHAFGGQRAKRAREF
jgi:quercetin dioxygenase-like cupin family protein